MDFDMSEICAVFFEESAEGLSVMESGLLNMDVGVTDLESINTIFRAAHSIKGGAGMFGFTDVTEFTHGVETLLDQMRSAKRSVSKDAVQLLLECVDCIREMLDAYRDKTQFDITRVKALQERTTAMLNNEVSLPNVFIFNQPDDDDDDSEISQAQTKIWNISFKPKKTMLQSGGDPLKIFSELQLLGELNVESNIEWLPVFGDINPELCYLSWNLILSSDAKQDEIAKAFESVVGQCELIITDPDEEVNSRGQSVDNAPKAPMVFIDALAVQLSQSSKINDSGAQTAEVLQPQIKNIPTKLKKVIDDSQSSSVVSLITNPADANKSPVQTKQTVQKSTSVESIRVSTDKVDQMINLVGELVITQSMLSRFNEGVSNTQIEDLRKGLNQLMRNTRELQESVMQIRMLPVSVAFNRFPRLVHDLSEQLGKKVALKLSGEATELDKTVLEKIGDPLVHLVRNSLDHGLETPAERRKNGKPETGTLELNAYHAGGNIILEVKDDGAGLNKKKILAKARERGLVNEHETLSDEQINNLIFQAGFSTADQVSNVSGRGVGMDVVKRNIADLGGHVTMSSEEGKGSKLTIRLPLTLAILDGQLIRVGNQRYIIPLIAIIESIVIQSSRINALAGKAELYKLRDEYLPIIRLYEVFGLKADTTSLDNGLLVIVEVGNQRVGIVVDELLEQQQVVIKSLEANYRQVRGVSGATILGDGSVALILDMVGLAEGFNEFQRSTTVRAVA